MISELVKVTCSTTCLLYTSRPETLDLLDGLEQLPNKEIPYKNITLREFDLDGALARRHTFKTVGAHVVDAITGKTKRKEEGLKVEILRLKDELAKKEAEITRIKKEAQDCLLYTLDVYKRQGSGSLKFGQKPIRKQSVRPPAG